MNMDVIVAITNSDSFLVTDLDEGKRLITYFDADNVQQIITVDARFYLLLLMYLREPDWSAWTRNELFPGMDLWIRNVPA